MDILWIQIVSPLKRCIPSLDSKANYKPMRKTPDGHMKIATFSWQYLEAYIMCRSTRATDSSLHPSLFLNVVRYVYVILFHVFV